MSRASASSAIAGAGADASGLASPDSGGSANAMTRNNDKITNSFYTEFRPKTRGERWAALAGSMAAYRE